MMQLKNTLDLSLTSSKTNTKIKPSSCPIITEYKAQGLCQLVTTCTRVSRCLLGDSRSKLTNAGSGSQQPAPLRRDLNRPPTLSSFCHAEGLHRHCQPFPGAVRRSDGKPRTARHDRSLVLMAPSQSRVASVMLENGLMVRRIHGQISTLVMLAWPCKQRSQMNRLPL